MTELISVVVTAYNVEKFIGAAIESILNQTYTHLEIILVDDGSKDHTYQIMEEYRQKDLRIQVLRNDTNMGIGYSANRAIEIAKSEIIIRMDADDTMLPNRIEEQVKFFNANPEISMTSCHAYLMDVNGKVMDDIQFWPGYTQLEDTKKTIEKRELISCAHTGFAAYKKAIMDVDGYRNIPCVVDLELFTRMGEQGHILIIMPSVLMNYRMHSSSVMAKSSKSMLIQDTRDWVSDCMNKRLDGKAELTFEEFMQEFKNKPWWYRFNKRRLNLNQHHYRNALVFFSEKKYLRFIYSYLMSWFYRPIEMTRVFFIQLYNRIIRPLIGLNKKTGAENLQKI